jgi:putative DNA-invertase from lambdoid prophage Rac
MAGVITDILALDRAGIEVISLREQWLDMGGPVRNLLLAVFGWIAEEERRQISSRSKAGVERARRQGKRIGRPQAELDLDRALDLRTRGLSVRQIARELRVPRSTLHRALLAVPKLPSNTPSDLPGFQGYRSPS